ncbi:MAG: hypothetical protein EXQ58_02180 [Acidobacteria bacterium]|nr:hypothetical protein [Acidobacteriota bacterium]
MRRFATLLILVFASLLPALAKAKPEPVRLRYTVDASQSAKRLLKIQAQIDGLPEGLTTIVFPDSKDFTPNRISHTGWQSEDGDVSALTLEDGQLVVESSGTEPVKLVFQLRGESFEHLDRATYLDEYRCLFHPQDVFLQIENQNPKVTVSFVLPDQWEVVSTARPAKDGSFSIETKRTAPFYLGRAGSAHDGSNALLWMAVEPGWPPAPELLASLRQQVRHRQRFGRKPRSRPLLAVFLAPSLSVPNKDLLAFGTPQLLALTAVPGLPETSLAIRTVQQAMARGLARMYLPAIANFSDALGPDRLVDYLTLKACLKTGVLGRAEFLDALALELWNTFGESAEAPAKPSPNAKTARSVAPSPPRIRCSGLLLDLALSFYGDTSRSLDAFLASGFSSSTAEPVTEADLRKRLRQEEQAAWALTAIFQNEDPQRITELLRPFGLLFDRRELPAFDFQLNETFQIAQLGRHTLGTTAVLETGDRILAINNHRLMLPDDLFKCRSRLTPGQEVQLDVERRNLPLRVTQRVAKKDLLKLEINKLADADKQQKLEQFLSVESDEN